MRQSPVREQVKKDVQDPLRLARLEAGLQWDGSRLAVFPFAVRPAVGLEVARSAFEGGERRLRDVLGRLGTTVVREADWRRLDPEGSTLLDVDRPSDLPGG